MTGTSVRDTPVIREAIAAVLSGRDLEYGEAKAAMTEIMEGRATPAQIGGLLAALRMKGESVSEITALASVIREKCAALKTGYDVMDIVGTGGDGANTFNISTAAAIVAAAGGVKVAKHGNRSVSSKCGAADVLEALGVAIDLPADKSQALLDKIGICFLFAPAYHASMRFAAPVRRELGCRTVFNVLGPLINPAGATLQLMGVYDENLVEPMARVLMNLGVRRAMVVHGRDGLDEVTLTGPTTVCEVSGGRLNSFFLRPEQFGLPLCRPEELVGGGPEENADIIRRIFAGERGPKRDVVVLNSAVCLYMAAAGETLRGCLRRAEELIDSGAAARKLGDFISCSREARV